MSGYESSSLHEKHPLTFSRQSLLEGMVQLHTEQEAFWAGSFGTTYIDRNRYEPEELNELYLARYGVTRTELNRRYLGEPDPSARVLEVGCSVGNQLCCLSQAGWIGQLYGVEINRDAVNWAHRARPNLDIVYGSALEIPFRDAWFDVVTISGVFIHIAHENLAKALSEVVRVMKAGGRYMGLEYWAPVVTEVTYRGHAKRLWKREFAGDLSRINRQVRLVAEEKLSYRDGSGLLDQAFLFEKVDFP